MKRIKSLIKTLKRIGPAIYPCGTPRIISNHSLKNEPTFTVCFFGKDVWVWVLNYFRQPNMLLAFQLSNYGWHSHKLLISQLIVLQEFRQTHQNTFAIFGEGIRAYWVLYPSLNPQSSSEKKLFEKSSNLLNNIPLKIFETVSSILRGL